MTVSVHISYNIVSMLSSVSQKQGIAIECDEKLKIRIEIQMKSLSITNACNLSTNAELSTNAYNFYCKT